MTINIQDVQPDLPQTLQYEDGQLLLRMASRIHSGPVFVPDNAHMEPNTVKDLIEVLQQIPAETPLARVHPYEGRISPVYTPSSGKRWSELLVNVIDSDNATPLTVQQVNESGEPEIIVNPARKATAWLLVDELFWTPSR